MTEINLLKINFYYFVFSFYFPSIAATKDGEPEQVVLIDVYKDKEKTPPESLKLWKNEDYILSILNEDDPMPENSGYLKNYHLIEDGTLSPKIKKKLLRQFSDNFAK